jgi:hypothetical protein
MLVYLSGTENLTYNGQAVCGVAASCGVACFLNAGKNDNLVINRGIVLKSKNMTPPGRAGLGRRQ